MQNEIYKGFAYFPLRLCTFSVLKIFREKYEQFSNVWTPNIFNSVCKSYSFSAILGT